MLNKLDRRFLIYLLRKLKTYYLKKDFNIDGSLMVDCCDQILEHLEGK